MATPYWKLPHRKRHHLRTAAQIGELVVVRCNLCHRAVTYLSADLAELLGPDRDAYEPPFPCSKCGKRDYVVVKLRMPEPADYGNLVIRRPGKVLQVQTWRTCKLGD